jgi:lactate 2-monooxygenase
VRGEERQTAVYLGGAGGRRPRVPVDDEQRRERAREAMSANAWAYIAGGAGHEETMRANREGFRRWRIVPRMLRDVSERDTGVELFGRRLEFPFLLAPIGVLEMVRRRADLEVARAAALEGIPMVISNQASEPMEAVAGELGPSPHWFQLYWSKSDEVVESLAGRAEACGCEAIVVTLDTTLLGWRTRDLDVAYLPFLRGKGIAQYTSDPAFRKLLEKRPLSEGPQPRPSLSMLGVLWQMARAFPGGSWRALRSREAIKAVQTFIDIYSRPSLTWENLAFLRERTELPILLKGVLHPDDARLALDHGVNGVIVSNHGGRQVDGAIATIEALPAVIDAVGGRVPVLLDSGVRGGADIFKALALGASAVLIGRPYVEALAIAGEAGVRELIQNFKADFDLTMGLAGCRSVAEIDSSALVRAP